MQFCRVVVFQEPSRQLDVIFFRIFQTYFLTEQVSRRARIALGRSKYKVMAKYARRLVPSARPVQSRLCTTRRKSHFRSQHTTRR